MIGTPVANMRRLVLTYVFTFLLLGMQWEAQWHALAHLGDRLQRPDAQAMHSPQEGGPCATCALFAGGSVGAPNDTPNPAMEFVGTTATSPEVSSPTAHAPSFYLIRAPPPYL